MIYVWLYDAANLLAQSTQWNLENRYGKRCECQEHIPSTPLHTQDLTATQMSMPRLIGREQISTSFKLQALWSPDASGSSNAADQRLEALPSAPTLQQGI